MGRNMTQHLQETCHTEKPSMGHHWNRILSNSDAILSNGNTHVMAILKIQKIEIIQL